MAYDPFSGERAGPSAGPLTSAVVAVASSLSVGWGFVVIFVFGAHLTTSAPFRARPSSLYPAGYSTIISRRALIDTTEVSRCVSAAGVRFLVILCPPRN